MERLIGDTLEFIGKVDGLEEEFDVEFAFSQVASGFGFTSFIATGLPGYGDDVENLIVAERWPEGWREHYRTHDYFAADPVSHWSAKEVRPFTWRSARKNSGQSAEALEIERAATAFRLVDGLTFPMHDAENWKAVVSLGTDKVVDLADREIAVLYMAATYFQMRASELRRIARPGEVVLSEREREVIKWLAAGKTLWEVGMILGVSEATVRSHAGSVRRKLGATNNVQAVAKAIFKRQI